MVEPPKLSPFGGADEADLVAALSKPGREDAARGNAAYPVQPLFLRRMFAVDHLNAMRIQKRFDGLPAYPPRRSPLPSVYVAAVTDGYHGDEVLCVIDLVQNPKRSNPDAI
jgi:hypothetical protein